MLFFPRGFWGLGTGGFQFAREKMWESGEFNDCNNKYLLTPKFFIFDKGDPYFSLLTESQMKFEPMVDRYNFKPN